ncbi:PadR family transcriptional regulator [Micromonospora sp. U21]|uniref:PadR family transcriptional regulator n=1 Tax=Micromonospora sp. U21 TaxID=2824899 RepID=UPI001B375617|nr:PadR family transcriptional regulator [Micromonospora sp. U21]MBQ0905795.1 PadR family transcriptional regulator [Micromonospora sp. U21]
MDSDRRGQWLRGVLDICVLALLAKRESYGYQLAQALDAAGIGPIQGGTLYPVLLRLQKTGLVTAQWREGAGGPARKYYRLTVDGHAALREGGSAWLTFVGPVNDIVTKGVAR